MKPSTTYKLNCGCSDHAVYFTIVSNEEYEPEALFINSKEMKSFQWITALMTSYSRQLMAGISVNNLVKDMKETFDPNGAYYLQDGSGVEVSSIVHHLGLILEEWESRNSERRFTPLLSNSI